MTTISHHALHSFATEALTHAGLEVSKITCVAATLIEADLLGHYTHGCNLLSDYCDEMLEGKMAKSGAPTVLNQSPVVELWDGNRLPGTWLTHEAVIRATAMAKVYGTGTVVIRRSHHIACLAAYLEAPARAGMVVQIQCSDPIISSVAPHGGIKAIMTPNPVAAGYPTSADPIMIDVSMSVTAMGQVHLKHKMNEPIPEGWLIDHQGRSSTIPTDLFNEPKGALLPLGGLLAGHKGFGLGLMVEAMTGGLSGLGRADDREAHGGWGANSCVQVFDPAFFGGLDQFKRQMDELVSRTHAAGTQPGVAQVRVPGEGGLARKRKQLTSGIDLPTAVHDKLREWGARQNLITKL
jgi:LDH2 family malate/lactate/ureidoglycolate dehydrogenase